MTWTSVARIKPDESLPHWEEAENISSEVDSMRTVVVESSEKSYIEEDHKEADYGWSFVAYVEPGHGRENEIANSLTEEFKDSDEYRVIFNHRTERYEVEKYYD